MRRCSAIWRKAWLILGLLPGTAWSATIECNLDGEFVTFSSPFYAVSFARDIPLMAYYSVESGGRSRRLLDRSLLMPSEGGALVNENETFLDLDEPAIVGENSLRYALSPRSESGIAEWNIRVLDDRAFELEFRAETKWTGEFFRLATAPEIAPMTVWAERSEKPPSTRWDREVDFFHPEIRKASFKLPAVLHFPDYGLVKVESDATAVYLQEHLIPDDRLAGLAFGPFNRGPHPGFRAFHRGCVLLSFHAEKELSAVTIRFTVLEENYPRLEKCDFSAPRFDGLKRCWQNAFPVNPVQQCMGDNLLLNGIAHLSMAFKADMLVFTPDLPVKESMVDALRRALEATFRDRVKENGRVDDYGWESSEVSLIALYDYLVITGDWAMVRRHLSALRKVVEGVLATDCDGDGIFESPFHGNRFEADRSSLNWWDDFAFGHKDAYTNLLAYRALSGMREIFEMLELKAEAADITAALARFERSFHKTFFNPKTGYYAGWISEDGTIHDYAFSFVNSMAIYLGLVEPEKGRLILRSLLQEMRAEGYDFVYGVPGPVREVSPEDRQPWDEMARWGRYENGGLSGQTAYHFLQALYVVGMREEADAILFRMLATFEREPTHSGLFPGYLQSVDWRTKGGAPTGYNYLADNYYFLLAAVTGHYGIPIPPLRPPR